MDIAVLEFENWYTLLVKINYMCILGVLIVLIVFRHLYIKYYNGFMRKKSIEIDGVTLGIGSNNVTLRYNKKDQEIAYKLWVELSTRKIGLEFDETNDVIVEIYNSWYEFFKVARELLKEIPSNRLKYSKDLIQLTIQILNNGLRPHLTEWQAKYRIWYEKNTEAKGSFTPQEIQKQYPEYSGLIQDLKKTNKILIEYKDVMCKIAFENNDKNSSRLGE